MKQWTGKERIEAAFRREYADRVPYNLDFGPHYAKEMGMTPEDYFTNLDKAYEIVAEQLRVLPSDMVVVPQNLFAWWSLPNLYRYKTRPGEVVKGLKDKADLTDLEFIDAKQSPGVTQAVESCQRALATFEDKAIRPVLPGPFSVGAAPLRGGMEQLILDIADDPQFVHQLMHLATEAVKDWGLAIAKTSVNVLVIGDSMASLSMISPKIYREFVFPYHKELVSYLKENAPAETYIGLHICGYLDPIMEDLVSLGIDYIELDGPSSLERTVEVSQKKVVVRGNIGAEIFLEGTKEQIEQAVKDCINIAAEGSAYVLSTGCQIPLNAPIENVRCYMEAAQKYGKYEFK